MWNMIESENDVKVFLDQIGGFHDSCLKELKYISGAYVTDELSMHPINDQRCLRMIFQRQYENNSVIEIEFIGLESLHLCPIDENYTCDIFDVGMFFENGKLFWGDSDWFIKHREEYGGTWLCAQKARWRALENGLGKEPIY
ncbi:MAG: hypothetical protein IJF53_05835 [Clostridia bacterium]|nr:hypothetical protein [Clostridia bacterium]